MSTNDRLHLVGVFSDANDSPLSGARLKFICTASYNDILNTVETEFNVGADGAYDFHVVYGTYTVQVRRGEDRNYSTVMANVLVANPGPWTIEKLITEQPNITIINPDLIEQMQGILDSANAAANLAKDWATKPEDQKVDSSDFSSKHYAAKSSKSANAALLSQNAAKLSETNAKTSETNADASEAGALVAKDAAVISQNAAKTSETNAAASASAALASQNAAKTSETNSKASETAALSSKNAAKVSETNAATSATSSSNSATASNASKVASEAAKVASEAARDKARKWADEALNTEVEPGGYSAKHWATKSSESADAASTSASQAATSKTGADAARDAAVVAKNAAESAKVSSETARDQSVTAKTQSESAKTASEAARDAAKEAQRLAEQAAASTSGSLIENGNADLSSGVAPAPITINGIKRATIWKVTVGGTVNGIQYGVGDSIVYSAQTNSYYKIDSTDSVTSVAGKTGVVTLVPSDVGLGNVNNTSDANKPVSTAQAAALAAKVDKTTTINGKPLNSNITLSNSDVGAEPAGAVSSGIQALKSEPNPFPIYLTEQELADSEPPFPDVWIPFNDSLQMLAGFGDYDRLYIGDKYFELPTKSVSFERATTATYIDKSGVLRTADINEPRFEKQGLLIEGQSTNLVARSEGTTFQIANASFQTLTNNVSGVLPVVGQRILFAANNNETNAGLIQASMTLDGGSSYTYSLFIKVEDGDDSDLVNCLGVYSASSASITNRIVIKDFGNGVKRLSGNISVGGTGSQTVYIRVQRRGAWSTTTWAAVVGGVQVESLPFASSYIPTNGAAVTRAADKCWLDSALNTPLASAAISVYFDSFGTDAYHRVFSMHSDWLSVAYRPSLQEIIFTGWRPVAGGVDLKLQVSTNSGTLSCRGGNGEQVIVFNGDNARQPQSSQQVAPDNKISTRIVFGATNSNYIQNLFGHIRNFRIWHHALSDLQIKRLK